MAVTGSQPVGLAACQNIQSEVRLVLEFLLAEGLDTVDAARVTGLLLSTVEQRARASGASWLMVLLDGSVDPALFARLGYEILSAEGGCAWVQKALPGRRRPAHRSPLPRQ